jgi:ribosomal protein S18 acetylase RimI-like enzyme
VISTATINDILSLIKLVNSAYRGEQSKKGWTTEANLIQGDKRIDADSLTEMMAKDGAVILLYKQQDELQGCVYLEKQAAKLYLGMLCVDPEIQGGGIGKKLLAAAEEHALKINRNAIIMSVITQRHELISWYERHGYEQTNERKPFPDDGRFGKPVEPLEFIILEKKLL